MNRSTVEKSKHLAQQLLTRADAWEKANDTSRGYPCPKEAGALRRSSMELTRALAEMRRPG